MQINPVLLTDSYKLSHRGFQVPGVERIYSYFCARNTKFFKQDYPDFEGKIVWFGMQAVLHDLKELWDDNFFIRPWDDIENELLDILGPYINMGDFEHFKRLHELGYLPIHIKSLPEGSLVPVGIPLFTITNTDEGFEWLPNYLETFLSAQLWKPTTVATLAREFRLLSEKYAKMTCDNNNFTAFQNHDFSFRGQASWESSASTGAAWLLSSEGTDNIPAIQFAKWHYEAADNVASSVKATEHSVASLGINHYDEDKDLGELKYLESVLDENKHCIFSYVADTYDYWGFLTRILPKMKDKIMQRQVPFVVRPDSGDPKDVICGTAHYSERSENLTPEEKGTMQILWELFGGHINSKGYKVLHPSIGLIYGDGITYHRAKAILEGLEKLGFASSNIVFGVGSYAITHNTRDTLGMAIKATCAVVDGKVLPLYKEPKTDSGKKSAKGFLKVIKEDGEFKLVDNVSMYDECKGELKTVFLQGALLNERTFTDIKDSMWGLRYITEVVNQNIYD